MTVRHTHHVDVTGDAPPGVERVAVRLVADPDHLRGRVPVACCFPGGGMSARYFELAAPWDMAEHLAGQGVACLLADHPGVGGSDRPDDGWTLAPKALADVAALAVDRALAALREGALTDELEPVPDFHPVGLGHSMGAMITALAQARHRPFEAVVLVGHSGRGLPEVLTDEERAVAGDPARIDAELASLARRRFGEPLPVGSTTASEMLVGPAAPAAALQALAEASAPMLAMAGLAAMIPGSHDAELAAIDVPVLIALAEHDIGGAPHEAPQWLRGSCDVSLHVLAGAFHNSNLSPDRVVQWDRIARWIRAEAAR